MKCKLCGGTAVINMHQHRLSLCGEHFLQWVPVQVARAIKKYRMFGPDERILVAVSGGKDSLALWDILLGLGYHADGLHINLGVGNGYSAESQARAEAFAAARPGAALRVVDLAREYGAGIPELARMRRGRKACSLCGMVKRHIMNQAACSGGYDAIATGHNLDDEVAVLLQNTLRWSVSYLARQAPVLPGEPGLARKVKPLVRLRERETAAYALVRGIDYIYDECPHAEGATTLFYKEILSQLETRSRGTKEMFYLGLLDAREQQGAFRSDDEKVEMHPCARCGQPTTAPGLCAFCRLWAGGTKDTQGEV
ncbi:MAG TPA: ATP-binding protein [Anaerolineae bacterium]|nr:ATP-binding protein [Anaerolineae bacterium]HOQ98239.1 ATP-binding protein [Anaerolineae bacterium]HPL27431.1 ATP-binding protein [Anaerolineae bacterium]